MTRVNFSPFLTFYLTIKTPTTRVNFYFFSNKKNSDDESYFYFLSSYFHGQSFSGLKFSKVWLRLKKRKFTREDFNSWACTASVASWTAWATWWSYWPATSMQQIELQLQRTAHQQQTQVIQSSSADARIAQYNLLSINYTRYILYSELQKAPWFSKTLLKIYNRYPV